MHNYFANLPHYNWKPVCRLNIVKFDKEARTVNTIKSGKLRKAERMYENTKGRVVVGSDVSNYEVNQQKDSYNRCAEEDYVGIRRRSCYRCRELVRIARNT